MPCPCPLAPAVPCPCPLAPAGLQTERLRASASVRGRARAPARLPPRARPGPSEVASKVSWTWHAPPTPECAASHLMRSASRSWPRTPMSVRTAGCPTTSASTTASTSTTTSASTTASTTVLATRRRNRALAQSYLLRSRRCSTASGLPNITCGKGRGAALVRRRAHAVAARGRRTSWEHAYSPARGTSRARAHLHVHGRYSGRAVEWSICSGDDEMRRRRADGSTARTRRAARARAMTKRGEGCGAGAARFGSATVTRSR